MPRIPCVIALFMGLAGCQDLKKAWEGIEKPSARIAGVGFENLSLESLTLRFDVEVGNPYSFALPLTRMDYALNSGGRSFLSGASDVGGTVPARGKRTIPLSAAIRFSDLMSIVGGLQPGKTVPYEAALSLTADAPAIGPVSVPIKHEGEVPIPAVPEVAITSIRWDELSLNHARATVAMDVKNTNDFAVGLNEMGYALKLGGQEVADGRVSRSTQFAKGQKRNVEIPISFSPARFGLGLFNILLGKDAEYGIAGEMDISSAYGPIKMPFSGIGRASLFGH